MRNTIARSPLWPTRLVCTVTAHSAVAKQPPEVARAVRSARGGPSDPSGPLRRTHGKPSVRRHTTPSQAACASPCPLTHTSTPCVHACVHGCAHASARARLCFIVLVHRVLSAWVFTPVLEHDTRCNDWPPSWIFLRHLCTRPPETIPLALYPHNVNKFVLIVPCSMWL
jgi:hypothetical protein